jgi:hypothetical protein
MLGKVCQEHLNAIIDHKPGKVRKKYLNTINGERLGQVCQDLLNAIKEYKYVEECLNAFLDVYLERCVRNAEMTS